MQRHESKTGSDPCGAAQYTQRKDAHPVVDPLGLMIGAGRHALADAGVDGLPASIDTVCVVNSFSRDDEDTPGCSVMRWGFVR